MKKAGVGIVGCGKISGIYFKNLKQCFGDLVEIVSCADLVRERAEAKAAEFSVPKVYTLEDMLKDPDVDIVLNLTIPQAHAEICIAALEAGKHVHVEKPLAVTRADGKRILAAAEKKNLLVGCAPDTFMGGGIQTCRKIIADGRIGEPVAAVAFMTCHGHESWHPDPEFYYKKGGGPMFDMGPYYLTALVSMMGPVKKAGGMTRITFPERTITSEPKNGTKIKVDVPTHVAGLMEFENGAVGTIITSFDVWGGGANLPRIEIYGSEGSINVPDPNTFGGTVKVCGKGKEWVQEPLTHGFSENSRGIGVADMACAIARGRKNRPSGELAYHILDIMHAFHDAAEKGAVVEVESSCERPKPLPEGIFKSYPSS
ncbi:MAG: Gfo/Idh/MocA family oxidoreductase [Eubacteriales bacterium]|nr:Gfo/Idh/MocA family oxidoreductase [Eubacteriales bacterium]